ncbi:MAG TPA: hypothetical protein VNL92_05030, partial [Dehalococcoidia bacterium]|nr:hypothetical protein [Dehalococcoidia bacterium]
RPSEVAKCVALINRTHKGQDLFRPYTADFLRGRLDDPSWGPRPEFWVPVYGWPDYWVLEEHGRVVACAGLWDRGRHIRELWHKPSTGERRALASTALMDWGFAEGHEEAMARLIAFFLGETARLGRDHLLAPIEHHPRLFELLAQYDPAPDTRGMNWRVFDGKGGSLRDPRPSRIYTDLAYW